MYASRKIVSPAVRRRKVAQPYQSSVVMRGPGEVRPSGCASCLLRAPGRAGRQLPEVGCQVAGALRDLPSMPFVIGGTIDAAAPEAVPRLGDDRGALCLRVSEVRVDVVDV